jgi:Domain of unknown function (DUF4153)
MNGRTKLGLGILSAGLAMGILADALLRKGPWGLNLSVWIALLVLAVLALAGWGGAKLGGGSRWLFIPAVFFAATFAVRDSMMLKFLSFFALAVAMALATFRPPSGRLRIAGVFEYALGMVLTGISAFIGIPLVAFNDIQWQEVRGAGRMGRTLAVVRGCLFAFPLLIVFIALFIKADAVFEYFVKNVFYMDFPTLLSHLFLVAFFTWVTAGYLRGTLFEMEFPLTVNVQRKSFGVGIIEIGVVLGAIDLLFFAFVTVQFRYLFGGHELVQATTGLTYAEYARRGFFELALVAALVLPLLLGLHWLLRKENPAHERTFRALAGAQVVLLFVIMASAVVRMRLYQIEYGLTELRLYTLAFIGWLAAVFLWFALTVLIGKRERFVFGAMLAGFLAIAAMHVTNPDALIVRTNIARVGQGRSFDAKYAARRSADAVPQLVAGLPLLSHEDQCTVVGTLLDRWSPPAHRDWRTWSRSRAQAWEAVQKNTPSLVEIRSGCPQPSQPKDD